jgi:hypothetical protein
MFLGEVAGRRAPRSAISRPDLAGKRRRSELARPRRVRGGRALVAAR